MLKLKSVQAIILFKGNSIVKLFFPTFNLFFDYIFSSKRSADSKPFNCEY